MRVWPEMKTRAVRAWSGSGKEAIRASPAASAGGGAEGGPAGTGGRGERGGGGVAGGGRGRRSGGWAGGHGEALDAEASGGLGDGDVRAAEGPAAAEGEVEAKAELAGFFAGETEGIEEAVGEIGDRKSVV